MPPVARNTRSQTNKTKTAATKNTVLMNKRNVDISPEQKPSSKRSAFGDITNATQDQLPLEPKKMQHGKAKATNQSDDTENMQVDSSTLTISSLPSSQETNSTNNNSSFMTACETTPEESEVSDQKSMIISPISDDSCTIKSEEETITDISKLWPGVTDFDKENQLDPFAVSTYAMDIFNYYKEREVKFIIPQYMESQRYVTRTMRAVLVDWLVEVQESFEMNHESLYLAVKLVDLYLSKKIVPKHLLQLVGAAAMLIASKFDERSPPALDDFIYICDDAYRRRELVLMEIDMLKAVKFDIGIPLSYSFLRRYARCGKIAMDTLTLARYILELSLTDYQLLDIRDSCLAAGALMLALKMKQTTEWSKTLEYYSGYTKDEVIGTARRLNKMLAERRHNPDIQKIREKYSHQIFYQVAKVPLVKL